MASEKLFSPITVGTLQLEQRIVMAPLTRFRADDQHVPSPLAEVYYGQRASAPGTLLITEGTFISARAGGFNGAPGIWSNEQVEAWKKVTEAVHAKGSFIFVQLQGLGRLADPQVLQEEGGYKVKGASAIPLEDVVPEPLTEDEIQLLVRDYRHAAQNALKAGFDGVELHNCYGYILDQFLQDTTNERRDKYGGSIENRARFTIEVVKTLVDVVGRNVAVRFSPWSKFQGMRMADPVPQFVYTFRELSKLGLAYLHLAESRVTDGLPEEDDREGNGAMVDAWTGTLVLASDFTLNKATHFVTDVYKDRDVLIAFGRSFLSNPDLIFRLRNGITLNEADRTTFYKGGETGYADYPFSEEFLSSTS